MICQDIVKHYGRKGTALGCIIKMDLKKAYDSIDWLFIDELLRALSFPDDFVENILESVRTPSFSLMINGSLVGFTVYSQGNVLGKIRIG